MSNSFLMLSAAFRESVMCLATLPNAFSIDCTLLKSGSSGDVTAKISWLHKLIKKKWAVRRCKI